MRAVKIATLFLAVLWTLPCGASADQLSERNWHFNFNAVYSNRALSGEIVNRTPLTDNAFGNLVATGDSMNLGSSKGLMLTLGARYKRWGFGLNYMPTSFSGHGTAIVGIDGAGGGAGVIVKTPLSTNVDVDMLLGKIFYNFLQTQNTVFGVGVGLGKTDIDLRVIPEVGNAIIYQGDQPFGFLSMHMHNSYKRFLYGFSLNGISATFEGVKVDYSDYTVDIGYRAFDKKVKCDVIGGYRMVNFAIDIEYDANVAATDVTMEGPFFGVNLSY